MALITAEAISTVAVELLQRMAVLPRTATRVPSQEYSGTGGTVTMRVRQPRTAHEQSTPGSAISVDTIDEVGVDVAVRHFYSAVALTDETRTLEVVDFARQVLEPSLASVVTRSEVLVADVLNDLTPEDTFTDDNIEAALLHLREVLSTNDVPAGNRWAVASPDVMTAILGIDKFSRLDATGSPSALRDAVVGRLFGLTVLESNSLDPGTLVGYHTSGLAFASLAPVRPEGAASSASASQDGFALRVVQDYDVGHLSDVLAVSTFAGASVVYEDGDTATDLKRVVKLEIETES